MHTKGHQAHRARERRGGGDYSRDIRVAKSRAALIGLSYSIYHMSCCRCRSLFSCFFKQAHVSFSVAWPRQHYSSRQRSTVVYIKAPASSSLRRAVAAHHSIGALLWERQRSTGQLDAPIHLAAQNERGERERGFDVCVRVYVCLCSALTVLTD